MANSVQLPSECLILSNEERHENDIDRISDLPDSVLCHILSFLRTVDSVATTILSKRWVGLWTQVPVLDFTYYGHYGNESWYVNFVFNVLLMSKAERIRKFSLTCDFGWEFYVRYLTSWISFAVRRNVQELILSFWSEQPHVTLPGCLFACKTLVSLELKYNICVVFPATVHFPCLRNLRLRGVIYAADDVDDSLRRFLSSCPVLEDLTVSCDYFDVLDINVPSLKRITLTQSDFRDDFGGKLLIKAPMLEKMEFDEWRFWDFVIEDTSNLGEAIILIRNEWSYSYDTQLSKLLGAIANVRFLSLWLRGYSQVKFPVFHNLVHLDIQCCCLDWHVLLRLLKCSHNLKFLVFYTLSQDWHFHRQCDQAMVESVPKCVSTNLRTFILTPVDNHQCDWTLVRYVLKNAKFLRQMKIGIDFPLTTRRRRLLRKLLKYPRASMACEISFFFDSSKQKIHL